MRHFSNAIALLALFVALGGTAWALAANSVKSKHIAEGAVRSSELRDDGVKSADLKNDGVKSADIAAGAVKDAQLGKIVARVDTTSIPDGGSGNATASCASGERMIGGGGHTQQSASDAIFHGSFPSQGNVVVTDGSEFDEWTATATNAAGGLATVEVKAWAVCLK